MTDRRSSDRGFNEIAIRATVRVLLWVGLVFGGFIVNIIFSPDNPWLIVATLAVLGVGAMLWVHFGARRRREFDQQSTLIYCPRCRFLTATPSGFCPRCGETIPSQRCRKCGYDLRGDTTGACSECGMEWEAPPGTFRCTWADCCQPNPAGTMTCQHCGREIAEQRPMTEEALKEHRKRTRLLWFGIFGLLPWPLDFILASLAIAVLVLVGLILLITLIVG